MDLKRIFFAPKHIYLLIHFSTDLMRGPPVTLQGAWIKSREQLQLFLQSIYRISQG